MDASGVVRPVPVVFPGIATTGGGGGGLNQQMVMELAAQLQRLSTDVAVLKSHNAALQEELASRHRVGKQTSRPDTSVLQPRMMVAPHGVVNFAQFSRSV